MRVATVVQAGPDMHRRARLCFQDVGSWRDGDRGIGSTSDGRCGYSLAGADPEPTGQIASPAAESVDFQWKGSSDPQLQSLSRRILELECLSQ
jgi:hypothetical protein